MVSKTRPLSWRRKLIRIGIIVGTIGAVLVYLLPIAFTSLIKSQVKLKRDSEIFKNWENFPVPLTTKFHFFHVLNPDDAMAGAKVQVKEVGPFTFSQWRRKEVLEWGPNDETVIYNEYKKYIYRPADSQDWDQEITTINPVVAGLAATIEETMRTIPLMQKIVSPFLYSVVSGVLISHGHNLFLKTTPRKLLQGHTINIFETASSIVEPFSVFGIKKEDLLPVADLPNNAFGILNGKNDTAMGPYEINTGITDQSKYTYMMAWRGEHQMHKWSTDFCNRIFGTDGAQFPPFRSKKDRLPIFSPDLCRSLYIIYDQEDEYEGIPVWKMKLDPKLFETPKANPDNECYCAHKKRKERCSIKGTMDLSGCLNGAPLVLSAPHFLDTEPDLTNLVDGLKPDREKHEFYLMFEPRLGLPIFAYGRLQLSIRVEKTSFLRGFDQVRNAFIPFVWIEESGGVDDFLAGVLKFIIVYMIDGSQTLSWFLMIGGWTTAILSFFYGVFCVQRSMYSEERLYSISSSSRDRSHSGGHKNSPLDSEHEDEIDSIAGSETANTRNSMELKSSAIEKEKEAMIKTVVYESPIYRRPSPDQRLTRSKSATPTHRTTSGRSLPHMQDLDEIEAIVPFVKTSVDL